MIQPIPLTLSHAEASLIAAFRQCDARGRQAVFACVLGEVEECPKPRPRFTLVPNCGPKVRLNCGKAKQAGHTS